MSLAAAASLRSALVSCLGQLDLSLTDAQIDTLIAYLGMLQRWNSVYNLTAVRDPSAMLTQHLADCLAIIAPLRREVGSAAATLVDVGSGGGLPAVVIATAIPTLAVTSVDTVGKKAAFVRQVAGELRLRNLSVEHARVESIKSPRFDFIASRAFATLDGFTRLTAALAKPGGRWLAMKGKLPSDEIAALPPSLEVFHVEHLDVPGLGAERCIVWMRTRGAAPPPSL